MHWGFTVLVAAAIILLVSRASYRIAAPFWSQQPVFHPYRLDLWFKPGIIQAEAPDPDRYVDRSVIQWTPVSTLSKSSRAEITEFESAHFLRTSAATYTPKWKHIASGMKGAPRPSVFCIGRDKYGGMTAAISARCMTIDLPSRGPIELYYIDNLCVHPGHRRQGLAPKAIRTLYQDISEKVHEVRVYLFKREGTLMGIMPLTVYDVCAYQVGALKKVGGGMELIAPKTIVEHRDIWDAACELAASSRVVVKPAAAAAVESIRNNTLRIYAYRIGGEIRGVALFRDPACEYDSEKSVELAAIVHDLEADTAVEFTCAACIKACADTGASLVLLDGCGQLHTVVANLKGVGRAPVFQTRTSLFLYNYAEKPHLPATCTFLF